MYCFNISKGAYYVYASLMTEEAITVNRDGVVCKLTYYLGSISNLESTPVGWCTARRLWNFCPFYLFF